MPDETLYDLKEGTLFPLKHKSKKITFSLREDKVDKFYEVLEKNNMNKSGVVETLIDVFLDNFEKQKLKFA